jgi:hypothetical protein
MEGLESRHWHGVECLRTVLSKGEQAPNHEAPLGGAQAAALIRDGGPPMDSHRSPHSPALSLARRPARYRAARRLPAQLLPILLTPALALPIVLGVFANSASASGNSEAPALSEASGAPVQTSANQTDRVPTAAQSQIARREYRASANRNGLQAPNRAHNLRTYFAPTGIQVHDRTQVGSPELLSLNLAGVGRGKALTPVGPGEVTSNGARVEIERPGLVEWFENSPAGLEQGVTLTKRPAGDGPLIVELSVLGARASLRDQRVSFATTTGRQLSYTKLVALDARGRTLEAHFELPTHARLQWVMDDAEAVYPVVIDPLLTATPDTMFQSDQSGGTLGTSVAGAGDVNGDGYADVIVGASGYDAGEANEGAAFIFLGSAAGIADANPDTAATQIESNQVNAYLGVSVAGAGDVNKDGYADVIVGAYLYDAGNTDGGAAFVFLGSSNGIADGDPTTADTQIESDQDGSAMGYQVAGAGDIDKDGYDDVIVGAYSYDTGLGNLQCQGWDTRDKAKPYPCCSIVPMQGTCTNEGAAFIFLGSAGGISDGNPATAATQISGDQADGWLGYSVAGAGDIDGDLHADVIIGSPAWDFLRPFPETPLSNWGTALIFLGGAAGIADSTTSMADTTLVSNQVGAFMGGSVAGAGSVNGDAYADVMVGVELWDVIRKDPLPPRTNTGSALIYHGSAAGIADGDVTTADTSIFTNQQIAFLGNSVAGAGDLDGDGYADVIVGAKRFGSGEANEGAAFVFFGSASGVPGGNVSTAAITLEMNQASASLGFSVAGAGDVNGDGADDVIVGVPNFDAPLTSEGAAFVYLGELTTPSPEPEPTLGIGFSAGVACLAMLARRRGRRSRSS